MDGLVEKLLSTIVDGLVEDKDISNKCAYEYETMYNSVISEHNELQLMSSAAERHIQSLCAKYYCSFNHCITVEMLQLQ